jgi:DNA-binding response OmpR family regulator
MSPDLPAAARGPRRGADHLLTAQPGVGQGVACASRGRPPNRFGFGELVARVEAVLRRARSPRSELLRSETLRRFPRLAATRGELLTSAREFAILACLAARRGEVVTREQLLQEVWGYESLPMTRTVDMHIAKLRRKIEPATNAPAYIVTVHGSGYHLVG